MGRAPAPVSFVLAALAASGCQSAQPAPQKFEQLCFATDDEPAEVIERLRDDAAAQGLEVRVNSPSAATVDLGEEHLRVPVPTDYGAFGTRVTFRSTRVRTIAVIAVESRREGGSFVTLRSNPAYWHPDLHVWLPGPYDVATGGDLLGRLAGGLDAR